MKEEIKNKEDQLINLDSEKKHKTIEDWLTDQKIKQAIAQVLPSNLNIERFLRIAISTTKKTNNLKNCSANSILKCLMTCSEIGVEPDGRNAYLIPYKSKSGGYECSLIIDYKALIKLAKKSGEVKNWRAEIVCENDFFTFKNGSIDHEIYFNKNRGKAYAVYSVVYLKNEILDVEIMTIDECENIRKRSKSATSGPWVTDFLEMCKKTVIKRHSKRIDCSAEFLKAVQTEDETNFIQADFKEIDSENNLEPSRLNVNLVEKEKIKNKDFEKDLFLESFESDFDFETDSQDFQMKEDLK